jgi:hypothetical protein
MEKIRILNGKNSDPRSRINIPDPQHSKKRRKEKRVRIADLVELAEDLCGGPVAGGGPGAKIKEGAGPPAALLPPNLTEYVLQYGVLAAAPEKTRERC